VRVIYILWLREVKKYLRSRTQIIASLGSQSCTWVCLGSAWDQSFGSWRGQLLTVHAPGVIAMTILFTSMFSGIALLWDRQFVSSGNISGASTASLDHDRTDIGRATVAILQDC